MKKPPRQRGNTADARPRNVRRVAVEILERLTDSRAIHAWERIGDACIEHALSSRDRRFLSEIVLGTLRHRLTVDCILGAFSRTPLAELEVKVREALRLGVYQLLFLDGVPAFAAISETVSAVAPVQARAYVNGVLRNLDRETRRVPLDKDRGGASPVKRLVIRDHKVCFFSRTVFTAPEVDEAQYLAQVYSHPVFAVRRWLERFGREEVVEMLRRNQQVAPLFVRAQTLKVAREGLVDRLRLEQIRCEPGQRPEAVRIHAPATELVRTRTFKDGLCFIQDETAMQVAPLLEPRPGEHLLDLCAAPGGKTTHLAERSGDQAQILAIDRNAERLKRLHENIARLSLQSIAVVECDVLESGLPAEFEAPFDGVLLDAPCSNSGVFGRRPDARLRFDLKTLEELVELQRRLLRVAADRVAPGGRLLYSTCSIEKEENQDQVTALIAERPDFQTREVRETLPRPDLGDGGFCALLGRGAR